MDPRHPDRRSVLRLLAGAPVVGTAFTAGLTFSPLSPSAQADPSGGVTPSRQFRGMWISSVYNIDWPSRTGLSASAQQAEFRAWLDLATSLRLNAVISQVRPTADSFWPSPHEPWSQYLTGTQGRDPGYDPLAFQVGEAHARNLEFHAWFNPYRVSMQADPAKLTPSHPAREHPDWTFAYGEKLYYNPGVPDVRAFVQRAMMDAVDRYDIDAVHFDDYFYPYPANGQQVPDSTTFSRWPDGFTDIGAWRRERVNLLVREMGARIRASKPWVKFGISPFGIWRNKSSDPAGSATGGTESYSAIFADSRRWVKEGWIDYIAPQLYWQIGLKVADYDVLARWWARQVEGTDVALYIGEAGYKQTDGTFTDPREITRHLELDATLPRVAGNAYFSAADVRKDASGWLSTLARERYSRPAIVPVIPRVPGRAPAQPSEVSAVRTGRGVRVRWRAEGATSCAIWRVRREFSIGELELADARNLMGTMRATGGLQEVELLGVDPNALYAVTAYDRTWRRSRPSRPVRVA